MSAEESGAALPAPTPERKLDAMRVSIASDALLHDPQPLFEPGAEEAVDAALRYAAAGASGRTLLTLLHLTGWRLEHTDAQAGPSGDAHA